jgi:hypothetical protein
MSGRTKLATHVAMLLLAEVGLAVQSQSTTLERMSLNQLARAADTVVRARCVGSAAGWENGAIWTFSEFEVGCLVGALEAFRRTLTMCLNFKLGMRRCCSWRRSETAAMASQLGSRVRFGFGSLPPQPPLGSL